MYLPVNKKVINRWNLYKNLNKIFSVLFNLLAVIIELGFFWAKFIIKCFTYIGVELKWSGKGDKEIATVCSVKKKSKFLQIGFIVVRVDKRYYRPLEVSNLLGDSSKAKKKLSRFLVVKNSKKYFNYLESFL